MKRERLMLAVIAACAGAALLFALMVPQLMRPSRRPEESAHSLARWLQRHPGDWIGFAKLSELAIASDLPHRLPLWRASFDHARSLAPLRPHAAVAFVRGGLFNWQELSPRERSHVIEVATSMLRDPAVFAATSMSLFAVTQDFELLLKNNPGTSAAYASLAQLALRHHNFAGYRKARDLENAHRVSEVASALDSRPPAELIAMLPYPLRAEHERIVRALLEQLHRRPVDAPLRPDLTSGLIDFAIRHSSTPLDGLRFVVLDDASATPASRARLAIALGLWKEASDIRIAHAGDTPEWRQYHVEKALAHSNRDEHAQAFAELAHATSDPSAAAIAAGAEVARRAGNRATAVLYERQLADRTLPRWEGLCGIDLCTTATAVVFRPQRGELLLTFTNAGADAAYLEVRVDDRRVAEGEANGKSWHISLEPGAHRLEVRIANSAGGQRRVRMS